MCGILGYLDFGLELADSERRLRTGTASMARRGPDGEGVWVAERGHVGFGHRRLSIIDLSDDGAQPLHLPDARLTITFNGEIYNFKELRAELESAGAAFRTQSDTEVLLRMYERWGPAMCSRLRGMYAFAIWDDRNQHLFLARDPLGVKPLYVARESGAVWFGSQVKALVAAGVPTTPSPAGHAGFLLWGHLPAGRTLYHEVVEFPPGTWATFDSDGVQRQGVHFSLLDELCAEAPPAGNRAEALAEAMRDSVRHHFVSDVPVGVFLSAGRDSCTLLGLAAEVVSPTPTAITLQLREFDGTDWDESELAQVAAEHYGAPHRVIPASKSDFEAEFESILAAMDQPSVDGVNVYFISKAAKEAGFKVALSGLGADEIFRGYSSFESVPKLVQATRTASKVPGFGRAVRMVASRTLGGAASPKYASLLEYGGSFGGAYFLRRGLHMPWELSRILDPDFARAGLAELEVVASLNDGLRRVPSSQARMVALESLHYMVPRLLRDADWASMHHSLEIRVPFVDVPLLRTVFAELLRGNAYSKADMAATLALPLPKAILERPKVGFMVPMHAWLQGNEPRKGGGSMRAWARQVYSRFAGVELPRSTG